MSSFRCMYYRWDTIWYCLKIGESITSYDFDTYCTDESRCKDCPYYNR